MPCKTPIWEAADDFLKRCDGDGSLALVALRIGDLFILGQRAQVIGISNIAMRRVQLNEAIKRANGFGVTVTQIFAIGGH